MHEKNIVHLDLKVRRDEKEKQRDSFGSIFVFFLLQPENVMLLEKNKTQIKIIDFGISRKLRPNEPTKETFGTPEFVGSSKRFPFLSFYSFVEFVLLFSAWSHCLRTSFFSDWHVEHRRHHLYFVRQRIGRIFFWIFNCLTFQLDWAALHRFWETLIKKRSQIYPKSIIVSTKNFSLIPVISPKISFNNFSSKILGKLRHVPRTKP